MYPAHQKRTGTKEYLSAIRSLCRRDRHLDGVVRRNGVPPHWCRKPGYQTLVQIILEQQVSLASARAVLGRLKAKCKPLNPQNFLKLTQAELSEIGFSRQKSKYCRIISEAIRDRDLELRKLHALDDDSFRHEITRYPGIGPWTADVYLLIALDRPDVWPVGDLALLVAAQSLKKLSKRPDPAFFLRMGDNWRPYRSAAARILWHHYLAKPES